MTMQMTETKIAVEWKEKVFTKTTSRGVTYTKYNQRRSKMFVPALKAEAEKLVSELSADENCYDIRMAEMQCGFIRI